jgi:type II secretory pathway component PulM
MIQLTHRERWLAWAGGSLLTLGTLYGFLIKPALDRTQRLYELLPQKQRALEQIERMGQRYSQLRQHVDQLQADFPDSPDRGSILGQLDTLLKQHGLDRLATLEPEPPIQQGPYTVTVIQIRLDGVTLPGLLAFLQELRTSTPPLHVETMGLTPGTATSDTLKAQLTLYSPSRTQTPA